MTISNFVSAIVAVAAFSGLSACTTTVAGSSGGTGVAMSTSTPSRATGIFVASNSMVVYPDPAVPGRFEVQQRAGRGGSDYWCAAGEYAIQRAGVRTNTRVYLETPYGAGHLSSSGKTAGFTVQPSAELQQKAAMQSNGLSMKIDRVGENWSAEHGRIQCKSDFERFR
jgi:hypothetical protein